MDAARLLPEPSERYGRIRELATRPQRNEFERAMERSLALIFFLKVVQVIRSSTLYKTVAAA